MSEETIVVTLNADAEVAARLNTKLDFVSIVMGGMTVSSALLFAGDVDPERLGEAIRTVGNLRAPHLFGAMHATDEPAVYVVPREHKEHPDSPGYTQLEIVDHRDCEYSDKTVPINSLLPQKVHPKMVNVALAMASLDELPIAAFRLTRFAQHSALGYRLNHMFFDQGGVVSLWRLISQAYRHQCDPSAIAPCLVKTRSHCVDEAATFASREAFDQAAPRGYNAEPVDYTKMNFGPPTVDINFELSAERLRQLKASSDNPRLSSNDFVHAFLLKVIALNAREQNASDDTTLRIMYAHNMRQPLGLPEHTHGDYVRVERTMISLAQAESLSIVQLAEFNRSQLDEQGSDAEHYKGEILWFREFRRFASGFPNCDFASDPFCCISTNWSSFPYEDISFHTDPATGAGTDEPLSLLMEQPPVMALVGGFARIGFVVRGVGAQRERILVLNVVSRCEGIAKAAEQLRSSHGFFAA